MPPDDPRYQRVTTIRQATDRATALTRELLAFSRGQVLEPQVLNPNDTVASVQKLLPRLIGEHITVVVDPAPEVGNIKADSHQLQQVLINLAANARDAMPDGGTLSIATSNVALDETFARAHPGARPGAYVALTVRDTGGGMDQATQSHVFEPFFTTKARGKGTGLGLSSVYGIVKQSGGYIEVASEPAHGTTFTIYLPRVDEAVDEVAVAEARSGMVSGSETVLLVEDEDAVRQLLRETLEALGYTVLSAPNGPEALRVSVEYARPIDLLVTDVVMPQMNGRALAERLAQQHPGLKTLYVSGHADEFIVRHGVLEPGLTLLRKPFTPDELAWKIREVLAVS